MHFKFSTVAEEDRKIVIGKEEYSITVPPAPGSAVVEFHIRNVLSDINLEGLVEDLENVGHFLEIAKYGVAAAENTHLQIQVQKIGMSITKLSTKSHTVIGDFRRASRRVILALTATYQYLLQGMEDVAVAMLSDVIDEASRMEKVARNMKVAFEEEINEVVQVYEEAINAQGLERETKMKLHEQINEFQLLRSSAERLLNSAIEAEKKAWKMFEEARNKEFKALGKQLSPFKSLINAFTTVKFGVQVFNLDSHKGVAEAAKQEKLLHFEVAKEQHRLQLTAKQQMEENAMKIERANEKTGLASAAIEALHGTIGGLYALSTIMLRAAQFWENMQKHLETLKRPLIEKEVKAVMQYDKTERYNVWVSDDFKERGVNCYAMWVALEEVCSEYMEKLSLTNEKLYHMLIENPRPDQASAHLPELVSKFLPNLERQTRALEQKQPTELGAGFQKPVQRGTEKHQPNDEL